MQETNAKILKQQITNTNINISQDLTKKFGLTVKYQAELRPPKNEQEIPLQFYHNLQEWSLIRI